MVVAGLRFDTSGRGRVGHALAGGAASPPPASPCVTSRALAGSYGGASPQPQRGTGARGGGVAPGCELTTASRVPHSM